MDSKENRLMVDNLLEKGYADSKVASAMLKMPREFFLPESARKYAYEDHPLPIGENQTISAPSIVAYMTMLLEIKQGDKVLEIGTGSGWQAALLCALGANVFSIERLEHLAENARANLEKNNLKEVKVIVGDGTLGYEEEAPYDKIIITAATPQIPQPLVCQLKEGGRIVAPVGVRFHQDLLLGKKINGELITENALAVIFVPLIGQFGFREEG